MLELKNDVEKLKSEFQKAREAVLDTGAEGENASVLPSISEVLVAEVMNIGTEVSLVTKSVESLSESVHETLEAFHKRQEKERNVLCERLNRVETTVGVLRDQLVPSSKGKLLGLKRSHWLFVAGQH